MATKLKKPIALLLAVTMAMLLNFPSGFFGSIGIGLTANAEDNTETSTETSKITFTALDGTDSYVSGAKYDKLIDGNKTSGKWLVTYFSSAYIVFKASDRIYVDGYTITTGDDNSTNKGSNPKDWTLKGCNDYDEVTKTSESWETIATVEDDKTLKDEDNTDYNFSVDNTTTAYQYFKLEITAIQSGDCMQMSEFTLSYSPCNHVWGEDITRTIDPTCTEGGYNVYTCSKCGSEKKVPDGTPATGHDKGEDGKCKNCGAYMISNADELKAFAELVNGGETSANAVLTDDITVNSNLLDSLEYDTDGSVTNGNDFTAWTPIGNYSKQYTGKFDGEGHTISGLYFNDTNAYYVGLFGMVGGNGTVLNVGVVDSYFSGNYVGGVCGKNGGIITNCYNTGTVSGNGDNVGGVCGYNNGGTIENCYNEGTVSSSGDNVGGVCGYNYDIGTIENCYSTGAVNGDDSVGGVCGKNFGTIKNCYNTGSVSGRIYIGGVCGENYGTIKNCYYLSKTAGLQAKTAARFKSGEVAYLLSQGCENDGSIWGQKIGTDDYPVLKGDMVYATTGCVTYNNSGDTNEKAHHYVYGICTGCGGYEEPEKDENGVYQISKATDLYWFAEYVNSGNASVNAVLTNDITINSNLLSSLEYDAGGSVINEDNFTYWTPIGSDANQYIGTFDGAGHTISGLYFNDKISSKVGLFSYVGENGAVLNVGVVDSYFKGYDSVGGVCGYNNGGTIENCYNEGTVSGSGDVGGVCGYNNGGTIENCYNEGTVSGSGDNVGGVCGYNKGTIKNCHNTGTVSGSGNYVGGVCGYNNGGTIENCYNEGTVSGDNVGGVCGYNNGGGTIENCYNEGTVSGDFVGGVCGWNFGTITNCYNTGTVSGDSVGGVCENNSYSGTIKNCYNTGTVSGNKVGGVCVDDCGIIITNCYYLADSETDEIDGTEYKTAEYFQNGTVCELVGYHSHQNGICILCGGYEPATKTTDKYDIDNDGNKDTVYEISSTGQLYWFAGLVNGNPDVCDYDEETNSDGTQQNLSANAILTADITVNSDLLDSLKYDAAGNVTNGTSFTDWTPIGWYDYDNWEEHYYTGTFDGQGHTISGLYFNDTNSSYVGLFGAVGAGGAVLNVGVVDSYFQGNKDVGGVCGYNEGTITNCYNEGTVGNIGAGGVCGRNNGTITNCYNTGTVSGVCRYNKGTITNCYYLAESETDTIDGTTFKTTDQFAGGEVAYLLQSAQTAAVEGDPVPQVWGQKLTGATKDASPVLTSDTAKTVYKVTFATKDNAEHAAAYTNYNGTVALPTNPTAADGYAFYKWSKTNAADGEAFTDTTAVTEDITVYAVSREKYGETDNEKTVTTTYGTGATQNLLKYTVYASYTPAEGETAESGTSSENKFNYEITKISVNDTEITDKTEIDKIATISNDTLTIPNTVPVGTYTLTVKATEKAPEVSLMSVELGTEAFTFDVTVTVNKLDGSGSVSIEGWTYGESAKNPAPVSATNGTENVKYQYKVKDAEDGTYSDTVPQSAGSYTVKATFAETDHYNSTTATADFTIAKATPTVTAPTANTELVYNGNAQVLVTAGTTTGGTMQYSLDNSTWSADIPTGTAAAEYTVYYKVVGDINYNDVDAASITVTIAALAENTPNITVNYTDETLTGFEIGNYTIDGTAVTPTDGPLAVESYMGQTILIVKKASDTNHADSAAQTLEIPARPTAPTGISATKASGIDASDGTITNVDSTMEYKAANADTWQSVTDTQITGLAAGDYQVRYKATQTQFASAAADVNISAVGTYTIIFVNYDNQVLQSTDVAVGSIPQYTGETPTKLSDDMYSYTFVGWEPEVTAVKENATYTAKFTATPRVYNVTLNLNGGTVENEDNYKTYTYGTGLILPTPTKENYYFGGWYDNEDFEGTMVTTVTAADTGDKTYYAKWTDEAPTEYLITFVNYDNSELQSGMVAVGSMPQYNGETPTRPDDSKYSYTFAGWSPEIAEVSGIAVYAAQFERTPIVYNVELTDEGKAVVLAPEAGTYALIFAAYDSNGVLKSIELQNITFDEAGEQEFEPQALDTNGAAKVKVMLWSDISEMTPKCGFDEMNLQ